MSEIVNIQLTGPQIDLLRGVLYEYYSRNLPFDSTEEQIRLELEILLADAETDLYTSRA